MLKIANLTKNTIGVVASVSKHQYCTFNLGTIRSSKRSPRNNGSPLNTSLQHRSGYLKQVRGMIRVKSESDASSTQLKDEFKLRPATHADCHAIKSIDSSIGHGFDTILYCIHQNISTENMLNTVLERSGQIVGYICGYVIDDGEALVLRHGRVMPEHRGRVSRETILWLAGMACSKYPNLKKIMSSSINEDDVKKRIEKRPFWKWTMQRPVEIFTTNADEVKTICESEVFSELEGEFNTDIVAAIPNREALRLLTGEICQLKFAPATPMIGFQPSGWKESTLGQQLQKSDLFVSRCPWTNEIKAFSFITITRGDYGVETNLEFYCDGKSGNEDLAIAHLLYYIREMSLFLSHTKVLCCFHHPPVISRECVKQVLNTQLGIPSNRDKDWTANLLECNVADALASK